jgi:molybdopterin converting factor subunit 1
VSRTIRVRLFARFRDVAGADTIDVPAAPNVAELRRQVAEIYPELAGLLARSAVAVNGEFADDDVSLSPGDEVAIIPPVSGG